MTTDPNYVERFAAVMPYVVAYLGLAVAVVVAGCVIRSAYVDWRRKEARR